MKFCKSCDEMGDEDTEKPNRFRSVLNPLFPLGLELGFGLGLGLDHFSASASLIVNSPQIKDMMLAACLLKGYFQPAGPLIHHHSSNSGPSIKSQNSTSLDSTSTAADSQAPASASEEPAESAGRSAAESSAPVPPPPAAHHMGYPCGYPPYQGGYYQGTYYPPPPQSAHFQPPPPPSFHQHYHHHQDLCYPPGYPPASYPPPPGSYRRFLQPPPGYYSPELTYGSSGPPSSQGDHGAQQMVVSGGGASNYSASLDPYSPPAPYYSGYSPGSGPACYGHPPSSRNLAFIEQTYQSCPCPMQLCPKNVHIGPLTGECKRPGALPLPPVALQLPQEPPGAAGPPSPARGSAGMPPQPSPAASNSARPLWDGSGQKTPLNLKAEESKTTLELKPLELDCKTEILDKSDATDIQNISKDRHCGYGSNKNLKSACNKWNNLSTLQSNVKRKDSESLAQGLLAISSKDMLFLSAKTQDSPKSLVVDDDQKIKIEKTVIPSIEGVESIKRKESALHVNRFTMEDSPKREKLIAQLEEILANNLEESKKRKRKIENICDDFENKLKKTSRTEIIGQKDENSCRDKKFVKKQLKQANAQAKLLKDRNEMVDWKEGVLNGVIATENKEIKSEESCERLAEKVTNRRKSNQDRSEIFSDLETQSVRKSKSCSPGRSKNRENSPVTQTKEMPKKKSESTKVVKAKVRKDMQEHSKVNGRKKNGTNGSKGGKQLGVVAKGVNLKSKKGKPEYAVSMSMLKKLTSKKNHLGLPRSVFVPKWSNGWSWDGESFDAKVYLTNDKPPVMRKCYSAMRHVEGDVIHPKDCILLKAGPRRIDLPFVAKVATLWENPDDGEMMVSLLWYYRPEHTDQGRQPSDQPDEIFASRHKDINSVACIEDKCFVLTYNEYCRYRKKVKQMEEGVAEKNVSVPRLEQPYFRYQRQPPCVMAPDMVFFCRRVYDFRQKRLLKNPT